MSAERAPDPAAVVSARVEPRRGRSRARLLLSDAGSKGQPTSPGKPPGPKPVTGSQAH